MGVFLLNGNKGNHLFDNVAPDQHEKPPQTDWFAFPSFIKKIRMDPLFASRFYPLKFLTMKQLNFL